MNIIVNTLVAATVGAGVILSGVSPVNANENTTTQSKSSQFQVSSVQKKTSDTLNLDESSASNSTIVIDAASGKIGETVNKNLSAIDKTEPYPYIAGPNFYVYGDVTTRPVGTSTEIRILNMLYTFNRNVQVQNYDSGKKKWVTVLSKQTPKGQNNGWTPMSTIVKIPGYSTKSKNKTVSYRVYFPKTSKATSYTSKTFKVKYVNPRFYTEYKKTLYNDMKKSDMCPNVIIETGKLNSGIAGTAYMGQQYKMKIVNGLKGKYRERVSVHECAHLKSDAVYKGDVKKLYKDSNKVFGIKSKTSGIGHEYLADCMSFAKMGKRYIPGYKKSCTSYQMKKAKRIWAGKKLY